MSCCEHKVRSDQGPPTEQFTPELQHGHVRMRVGGRFSAMNYPGTFNSWKTKISFITLSYQKRRDGCRSRPNDLTITDTEQQQEGQGEMCHDCSHVQLHLLLSVFAQNLAPFVGFTTSPGWQKWVYKRCFHNWCSEILTVSDTKTCKCFTLV